MENHEKVIMNESLKEKILRRGQLKAQLTRFETFLSKCETKDKLQLVQIQTRLDTIIHICKEFDTVQSTIELLDPDQGNHEAQREEFEEKYFLVVSNAKHSLENANINISQNSSNQTSQSIHANEPNSACDNTLTYAKLPPISIPEFDGSYERWTYFQETFNALVNNNASLSNVQKYYYLQNSLKASAAQLISSITVSDQNYHNAWQLLKDRYENKKALIHSHIKAIFEIPEVYKENHTNLRKFTDIFLVHARSLDNLGENINNAQTFVIYLLNAKLPISTRREWELSSKSIDTPNIKEFTDFLIERCRLLEALEFKLISKSTNPTSPYTTKNEPKTYAHITREIKCVLCPETHFLYACKEFHKLDVDERLNQAKRFDACTNCLRHGHQTQNCRSVHSCSKCGKRHHSLLHFLNPTINHPKRYLEPRPRYPNTKPNYNPSIPDQNKPGNSNLLTKHPMLAEDTYPTHIQKNPGTPHPLATANHCISNNGEFTILPTAVVHIFDINNTPIKCTALLDSGSQSNFITHKLFNRLGIPSTSVNLPIMGFSQNLTTINQRVVLNLASIKGTYKSKNPFLIISNITGMMPQRPIKISKIKFPANIELADDNYAQPKTIDILLGANIFFDILERDQIKLGRSLPLLQQTKLGYVVSGNINLNKSFKPNTLLTMHPNINQQLERFWTIEDNYGNKKTYSTEEKETEEHFVNTTTRDESGRFIVRLPLKDHIQNLGESYETAKNRFLSQERRFIKNPNIKKEYVRFMSEYKELNHMSILNSSTVSNSLPTYYLPHHLIQKEDSTTSNYRVVFDGSARTTSGYSLNDTLKIGPTVQNDLFDILVRFRKHPIILIGDIAKMYRQIKVDQAHHQLQCILWREDPTQKIKIYCLNRLTYGISPSSFIATRCLKQISLETRDINPLESYTILNDFYVDDLLTGGNSPEEVLKLKNNLTNILNEYGFELRKFSSNHPQVLQNNSNNDQTPNYYVINDNETTKTLGISLNLKLDAFEYQSNSINSQPGNITKRIILSTISKLFDPLGLLGPLITQAKIILQHLWCEKIDWDSNIPTELHNRWLQFYAKLSAMNTFSIPRHVLCASPTSIQLHGFCDASLQAYGACIYLRSTNKAGNVTTRLVAAKSRVAPLKTITLPCLELCGALLLSKLTEKVTYALKIDMDSQYFYTDSTIVLSWLSAEPNNWKTFVCNRVSEIQSITQQENWYHISSEFNPADIISRGITPSKFESSSLWWNGPDFLKHPSELWPKNTHISNFAKSHHNVPEIRIAKQVNISIHEPINPISFTIKKMSSYLRLINIVSYCMRFIHYLGTAKNRGPLTIEERLHSENAIIRIVQNESFPTEVAQLKFKKPINSRSKLISLNPFMDEKGIIRVGGRLKNSDIDYNQKHPILLPYKHHLTTLIIQHEHCRHLHSGNQATLSNVRAKYWPLKGKQAVKQSIKNCITCFKAHPKVLNPIMSDLPPYRVKPNRPFTYCGVDYAGPFQLKDGKYRNRKIIKGYACVFICMSTKAIHLELVTEMTSKGFINALERFVSRRGCCQHIYSDNGTNFVGANNELSKISHIANTDEFQGFNNKNSIQWHFIPANSPHFGGLWESAVGSLKHHLKRILSNNPLTFEEFYTVLSKVEAVLNSRPLTPLSNDPSDLEALTPGHFLIGSAITAHPEATLEDNVKNLTRFQHLHKMHQDIWSRWKKDYLHTLQQRHKWRNHQPHGRLIDALVILKDDNAPPTCWPLGRITEIHPGTDNVVRVVSVRTKNGTVKRALAKVCLLPISE